MIVVWVGVWKREGVDVVVCKGSAVSVNIFL